MLVERSNNPSLFPNLISEYLNSNSLFENSFFKNKLPAVNVKEDDKEITLEVAVPGIDKDDLKITLEDGTLSVFAEKISEDENESKNYTRKEFSYNSFNRSFQVPKNINQEEIVANCKDGVLKLVLCKNEAKNKSDIKTIKIS